MSPEEKIIFLEDLADNPNYIAYQTALKAGQFKTMEAGTFVAYHDGQLVGMGMDRDKLSQELQGRGLKGVFLHQVGVERTVSIRSPRTESS